MLEDRDRTQKLLPTRNEPSANFVSGPAPHQPQLRPRKRKTGLFVPLALASLAVIVVLAGLWLRFGIIGTVTPDQQAILPTGSTGHFVAPPYNISQINALEHLVDHMNYRELASLYVSHMTLDEKLGQMIMTESEQNTYSDDLNYMITQLHVGGMIMYESHLQTAAQARNTTSIAQQNAKIPLLTSVDEEGGAYVNRMEKIDGAQPGPWEIYQSGSLDYDRQQAQKVAHNLLNVGLNTDLAPDVDVMIVPGIDTEDRTFGTTADSVIHYAGPYLEAMQSTGLIACIKHYPGGLGDTPYDAHDILPTDGRTAAQIYATELAPYQTLTNSSNSLMRPAMIMSTDVMMPAIDPTMPGELSHIFMTDILRKQFGYDGVALTDALYMGGISAHWSQPEAAVLAIAAGNDMIMGPMGSVETEAVIQAFRQALQDGQLTLARVNEAVTRIIALKMQYHLMPVPLPRD